MTAHKHAALMLQYAEDATKTDKPWELWEMSQLHLGRNWIGCEHNPNWADNIEYRRKPVKWQPVGGGFLINNYGIVAGLSSSGRATKEFGHERPTKEQAQRAAVEMRRFNRLLALRDELCGDELIDWDDWDEDKYFVSYSHSAKRWYTNGHTVNEFIQPFFTSLESVQRACDMLNSGEVEL